MSGVHSEGALGLQWGAAEGSKRNSGRRPPPSSAVKNPKPAKRRAGSTSNGKAKNSCVAAVDTAAPAPAVAQRALHGKCLTAARQTYVHAEVLIMPVGKLHHMAESAAHCPSSLAMTGGPGRSSAGEHSVRGRSLARRRLRRDLRRPRAGLPALAAGCASAAAGRPLALRRAARFQKNEGKNIKSFSKY